MHLIMTSMNLSEIVTKQLPNSSKRYPEQFTTMLYSKSILNFGECGIAQLNR